MKKASPKKITRRKRYELSSEKEKTISPFFSSSRPVEDEANLAYEEEDRLSDFNPARGFYSGGIEHYINKM
jgi:hypothetical protein